MTPQISVIIPAYNGERDITRLLDALNAQTQDPATVEYIIVNNNSRDHTRDVITEYAKTARITIICIDENEIQGSYAARNKGIRAAKAELLFFTDADCIPQPDWIKNLLPGFEDPAVGGVAGAIHAFPGDSLLEEFAEKRKILSQVYTVEHSFIPYGQTANLALRKDVFRKIGFFRPYLKTGGDADICWRMARETDFKLAYRDDAVVLHRHRTNFADLYEQFERYGRSDIYLNQLYGYNAIKEPRWPYYIRKMAVWGLRYPVLLTKLASNKASKLDVYEEPIKLFTKFCRYLGANRAKRAGPLPRMEYERWFD